MTNTRHFYIKGQVQGVYFRAGTQQCAKRLGLTGWVRNLRDGRVEALASGQTAALDDFESWLRQGPENALVEQVTVKIVDESADEHRDFVIK